MKDLSRNVAMICPICGNDQFSVMDEVVEDFSSAEDDIRIQCLDCKTIFTKAELIEENQEVINVNIEEITQEAIKEIDYDLRNALKKMR